MEKYISKSAIMTEIEKIKNGLSPNFYEYDYDAAKVELLEKIEKFLATLEVKEIETPVIPKHSYFEEIYHCGSEPRWKIGDILAVYEFYSDYEGEYIYGKITDVKMDETEDWCYTFENGDMVYENILISDETYKKN